MCPAIFPKFFFVQYALSGRNKTSQNKIKELKLVLI
jgi:hypothetical protein